MRIFLTIVITFTCTWFLLTKVTIEIPAVPELKVTIPQTITITPEPSSKPPNEPAIDYPPEDTPSLPPWSEREPLLPPWNERELPPPTQDEIESSDVEKNERETFALINQERKRLGLYPISWNESLHRSARSWSEQMQTEGNLYHDVAGVMSEYFAECIYGASWSHYRTPEQTVDAWMSSDEHRAILLGFYSAGAIGIAKEDGFFATYRCW